MKLTHFLKLNPLKSIAFVAILFSYSACTDDDSEYEDPFTETAPPIVLDCYYFDNNPNAVLVDNPNAEVDYLVTCRLNINDDVTIEPGVVIEFEKNTGFSIKSEGSLKAIGSQNNKIIFRGTQPNKGHWDGLFFDYSNNANNILDHVVVRDGGGRARSNRSQGGVSVYAQSSLTLKNSTINNNEKYGFSGSIANFNSLVIENNTFENNEYPVLINTRNLHFFKNNNFENNQNQVILVDEYQVVEGDITWNKADVPYRVEGSFDMGKVLTIQPGVVIQMPQDGTLKIRETGGLIAVGTSQDPIIFTSTTQAAKAWNGIYVSSKYAGNTIAHAEIHYSGMGVNAKNVYLWYDSALNIHDVKFYDIEGCAINWRYSSGNTPNPNLTIGSNIYVNNNGCIDGVY